MADPIIEADDGPGDELDMSDEDFAKLPIPEGTLTEVESAPEVIVDPIVIAPKPDDVEVIIDPEVIPEKTETKVIVDPEIKPEVDPLVKVTDETADPEKKPDEAAPAVTVDYQAEYNKLIAPFKANGSDMQVKNTDDAIKLMKMGANYHKKMAGMKPSLKTLKLLENNGLLDPEKLNFLIDIHKGKPEAITKLIKDNKIDPLDINVTADSDYKPTHRTVTDTEMDLDSVLEDIRDTPSYTRTLNVVTKEWDDASRKAAATEPHIISIINGHIADGTYDKVIKAVNYERSLGNLKGVADFDAYKKMGDALYQAGQLSPVPSPPSTPGPLADETLTKQTSDAKEAERIKKKKAAGPVKTTPTPAQQTFNPLALSDEEFAKFDPKQFRTQP